MTLPIIHGTDQPVKQPSERQYDPDNIAIERRHWIGIKQGILDYLENLEGSPERIRVVEGGPTAEIHADYDISDQDSPLGIQPLDGVQHQWTLSPREIEKDLRQHPDLDGFSDQIAEADKKIEEGLSEEILDDASIDAKVKTYVHHIIRGATSFLTWEYIIVHTQTAARSSQIKNSTEGIGAIHATNSLSLPSEINIAVPDDYKWLKTAPQVEYVPRGGVRITQRYYGAPRWSALAYEGGAWDPAASGAT